jgi:hypothetical protein
MLLDEILDGCAHVVLANPPYIVDPDGARREAIRSRYESAHAKFGLGVPFTERLFQLAREGGWIAQITSNAFMKREHGRPLIETVLPRWDVTHVVDTSGAYIPGHGTPTVILAARARAPRSGSVVQVGNIRGEQGTPPDGEPGEYWRAVLRALGAAQADDPPRPYGVEGGRILSDALRLGRSAQIERRLKERLGPGLLGAALVLALRDRRWIYGDTIRDGLDEIASVTGVDPLVRVELDDDEDAEVLALVQRVTPPRGPASSASGIDAARAGWATRDTDWIGDLYQLTHEGTVKRDALCQTPWFVRDLLIQLALIPATEEQGLDVRVLDPTCGTGHLLCGAFWWLFDARLKTLEHTAYGAANAALRSVEGVELTTETAALARLRLVLAWADATGDGLTRLASGEVAGDHRSLRHVADRVRVAVGNSLLSGCAGRRFPDPAPVPFVPFRLTMEAAE